jgi:hypothetical protein
MALDNGHGGMRRGAGRPKGSRMRRSEALADSLIHRGNCPVEALVRIANAAEADGDRADAISAWKSVLPYVYPKPKAVEVNPEGVLELAAGLATQNAETLAGRQDESYRVMLQNMTDVLERGRELADRALTDRSESS